MHPAEAVKKTARQCARCCDGSRRRSGVVCPLYPARLQDRLRRRETGDKREVRLSEGTEAGGRMPNKDTKVTPDWRKRVSIEYARLRAQKKVLLR